MLTKMITLKCDLIVLVSFIECSLVLSVSTSEDYSVRTTISNIKERRPVSAQDISEAEKVANWLGDFNKEALKIYHDVAESEWNYYIDMTNSKGNKLIQKRLEKAAFQRSSARQALQYLYGWSSLDETTQRQLHKMTDIGISAIDKRDKFEKSVLLELEEEKQYSNSKVKVKGQWMDIIPDAYALLSSTQDINLKKDTWTQIHNSYSNMRTLFSERLGLANEAFQILGYANMQDYWESSYSSLVLSDTADKLWQQVQALYELLHTYVRHKLKKYLKDDSLFPSSGHLPVYLVGTPSSRDWLGIYDKVIPYHDVADINLTKGLSQKVSDVKQMARKVNEIFSTMGLNISNTKFWSDSVFSKPKDTNVSCVPRTVNVYSHQDTRLQMCGEIDQTNFLSLFDLLGEAAYISSYSEQPVSFQSEGFPDFGTVVGGVVALSALMPSNLKIFDLVDVVSEGYKSDVNYLTWMALRILPRLAQDYSVGRWKQSVYSRIVNESDYELHWWQLRCRNEGLVPFDTKSDDHFDAAGYTDAWKQVPFYRSFLSTILQFQLHDSLCYETGHTGALHKCNLLNKEFAGQKLRRMMRLGSSYTWRKVINIEDLRVKPLLSYFSPLKIWLQGELSHIDDLPSSSLQDMSQACLSEILKGASSTALTKSVFHQMLSLFYVIIVLVYLI